MIILEKISKIKKGYFKNSCNLDNCIIIIMELVIKILNKKSTSFKIN